MRLTSLPKRCKKKEATALEAKRMSNEDIEGLLEEIHRRYKLDTDFDIEYNGEDINVD